MRGTCIQKSKTCNVALKNKDKATLQAVVKSLKTKQPVFEPKLLGAGAFGKVVLNQDGSVTKTFKGQDLSYKVDASAIEREANFQKIAAKAGLAPKVLSYDKDSITMERVKGRVGIGDIDPEPVSLRATLLRLHKLGIAHNDIHGGNTAYDGRKTTLLDFGLASTRDSDLYYEYYSHVRKDNKLDYEIFDGPTYKTWLKTQPD